MGKCTVTYDVLANSSPDPRTGTLTVAGQTYTINQGGLARRRGLALTDSSDGWP